MGCLNFLGAPQCVGIRTGIPRGNPDWQHLSTSYVESQNLNCEWVCDASRGLPTRSKRSSRITATWLLSTMLLQFLPRESNLACDAAMETGLTDHIWSLEDLVGLLDSKAPQAAA